MKFVAFGLMTLIWGVAASGAAHAAEGSVMWRCPGNEYNNTLSATAPAAAAAPTSSGPAGTKVDPADQRARDTDARRILEAELKREEDRLATLKAEYANGQPERQGNEQNYQKYLDRVADMKSAIERKTGDIAALRREIAKQPQ
jgi:hypothetical protein